MSSPDEPGVRRRRRRSPRAADDRTEAEGRIDRAGTASAADEPELDGAEDGPPAGRRGRSGKPAARRSGAVGGATKAKPAGSGRSAGQRRQPGEPSARTIREAERGWRDLAGSGSSQLGVSGALRARDVSRPGPAELAEAERTVQLVRRQWQPPPDAG